MSQFVFVCPQENCVGVSFPSTRKSPSVCRSVRLLIVVFGTLCNNGADTIAETSQPKYGSKQTVVPHTHTVYGTSSTLQLFLTFHLPLVL